MTTDCKYKNNNNLAYLTQSSVVSFSRRSLISNENKYRQSLEYKMFLAENPGYGKNQTMAAAPSVQFRNLQQADGYNPSANFPSLSGANSPQGLSQTFDLGP